MKIYCENEEYIGLSSFYALSLQGFTMPYHSHASFEVMYIEKGSCSVYIGEKEFCMKEHQFILLDQGVSHRLLIPPKQDCMILNVEFHTQTKASAICLRDMYEASPAFQKLCCLDEDFLLMNDNRSFGYALKDLIDHTQLLTENGGKKHKEQIPFTKSEFDYLTQLLFERMLMELCKCNIKKTVSGAFYVKKACTYIQEHLMEEIRISMISDYVGISGAYLQSLFSEQLNYTISEYINYKRLEIAVFLLVNSSLAVTDIAFHAGYNSRQHFGDVFKKFYGVSPITYRKLHQKVRLSSTENNYIQKNTDDDWGHYPAV